MDIDIVALVRQGLAESKAIAVARFAEERGIDPSEVEAIYDHYNSDTNHATWLCWQRGTWVYTDEDGNVHRR